MHSFLKFDKKTIECMEKTRIDEICLHCFTVTDVSTGEVTCRNCGVVVSDRTIDYSIESSTQSMEHHQKMSRTGQKTSLKMADMGLSTIISQNDRDSSGKIISGKNKRSFYRLRMWDRNSKSAITNQSYIKAFTFLDGMRSKLGLPEHVVEKSAYIFRKAEQNKLLYGRSSISILCAVVYLACRKTNTPRTISDIAEISGIKKKVIQRTYRLLVQNLDMYSEAYSPDEFLTRISSKAKVSEKTKRDASKILDLGHKKGITSGKNPMSMAAAAVYLAIKNNNDGISQTVISRASGISAVTIRNRVKELEIAKMKQ